MAIDYHTLKQWRFEDQLTTYTARDTILYALSLGYGEDPLDPAALRFVYERGLQAIPTLPTVLGAPGAWAADPRSGITWQRILHGEHRMVLHRTVPPEGCLRSRTRIARIVDKGADKGALVITERSITDESDGSLVATIEHTSFCRADGGLSQSDEAPPPLPACPDEPEHTRVTLPTLPRAALLYRLNGDQNPIHIDPAMARGAGFDRPILHGLCTYGMAARALVDSCCEHRPERLKSLGLRFAAPFFPGETLTVRIWRRASGTVQFDAMSAERGIAVLTHGNATVEAANEP